MRRCCAAEDTRWSPLAWQGGEAAAAGAQEGMLVRWDGADDSAALVLLDAQLAELRLLSVSALQLQPLDAAPLPTGFFPLTPPMLVSFRPFFPKSVGADRRIEALSPHLQSAFLYGLLQTRALKALQGLLRHPPSMRVVLDSGLLPAIMASAATPVPLLGLHHTESLQTLLTNLEQMHIEAATAARLAKAYAAEAAYRESRAQQRATRGASASAGGGDGRGGSVVRAGSGSVGGWAGGGNGSAGGGGGVVVGEASLESATLTSRMREKVDTLVAMVPDSDGTRCAMSSCCADASRLTTPDCDSRLAGRASTRCSRKRP